STGTPSWRTFGSHLGASTSYTELGPPERTRPTGSSARISSSEAVHGRIAENTSCSRMRRAINCVYWPPKSRTTTPCRVLNVPPAGLVIADSVVRFTAAPASNVIVSTGSSPERRERVRGPCSTLPQNDVDQPLRHNDYLCYFPTSQEDGNTRVAERALPNFVVAHAVPNDDFPAHAAIDLNDHFKLLFAREVFTESRPFGAYDSTRIAKHGPEFFSNVGRHRRKHQHQNGVNSFQNHGAQIGIQRFLGLQLVDKLHHQGNGSVEMPARLKIVGDALERLVRLADEDLLFRRGNG